ncbi:MAG TPA: DUF1722 domain-containing protein, partial [Candidatus Krumholzibacterium sp.]|nr:DUF1722 domain-containing protein [Candidatus Krumholzibacterium sp.]
YLNRQSLLGEHRELHAIVSIIVNGKKGYSRHPETLRWKGYGWALRQRHLMLAAEMALRGFTDRSPVGCSDGEGRWPEIYIDEPVRQFELLRVKYEGKEGGRIPLPGNAQQLWSHHKYSVMARDQDLYRRLGSGLASASPDEDLSGLARTLTEMLREPPAAGGTRNAIQHMWGYVSDPPPGRKREVESWSDARLLEEVQSRAVVRGERYLLSSTALGELGVWLGE